MSDDHKYQGHANYETWAVKLWLDNEEGSSDYWRDQTRAIVEDPPNGNDFITSERQTVRVLAGELKAWHEEAMPELEGFAADLLNAAFSEVDWDEMAESMIGDMEEEIKYEAARA